LNKTIGVNRPSRYLDIHPSGMS